DTITNAIKKGTGALAADDYEAVTYEGYAPGGVALIIEALTNNRSRTAPDLRALFERNGGNLGTSGSVAFQFTKAGVIVVKADAIGEDDLMEAALEAGADDVKNEGEAYSVITSPTAYHKVKEALTAKNIPIENAQITYLPNTTVALEAERAAALLKFIDALEDNDDVQTVSHNAELPESVTAG
ncbi:MAG: YebC/PmpR family DNA-binding transcriptional regulator, partial [Tepidisphaeraceae bacterium]